MSGQIIADPSKLYELDDNFKKMPSQIDDIIADYSEMISHTRDRVSNTLNQWKRRQQQAYEQLLDAQEALDRAEMSDHDSEDGHVLSYYYEAVASCQNRYNEISDACTSIEQIYDQVEYSATSFTRTMGNLRQDYTTLLQKSSYILTRYADLVEKSSSITSSGSLSATDKIIQENSHSSNQTSLSPAQALASYMYKHNYGKEDHAIYSQDPEWRVLHKAANPDCKIPPLDSKKAFSLLFQYMSSHNYGTGDFEEYSKDPIWQELHNGIYPNSSKSISEEKISYNEFGVQSVESIGKWLKEINPNPQNDMKRYENCGKCAAAVFMRLNGNQSAFAGIGTYSIRQMNKLTGKTQTTMTPDQIRDFLIAQGPGSHAVVGVDRASGAGHWFNAYYDGHQVYTIDGQDGSISGWPPNYEKVVHWDVSI